MWYTAHILSCRLKCLIAPCAFVLKNFLLPILSTQEKL
jgi:hypothetical protein